MFLFRAHLNPFATPMKKILLPLLFIFAFGYGHSQALIDTARDFSYYSTHGELLELYPTLAQGKVVLLEFFTTSCGPCTVYAPDVQQIYEAYGENQQDVVVWGLDWGNDNTGVLYFDSVNGLTFPSVSGMEGGANQTSLDYQIQSRPTVVIILPNGVIHSQFHVWGTEPTFHHIDSVLTAVLQLITSVPEFRAKDSFHFYPNPASDYLYPAIQPEAGNLQVSLYTGIGIKVAEYKISMNGSMDVSGLPPGLYFAVVRKNQKLAGTGRILIRR